MNKILKNKNTVLWIFISIALLTIIGFVNNALLHRIGAFGCFDDCHTFTTGYFINRGRTLYSEIFSNHQILMPYISALIQRFAQPDSLYALVMSHRLFIIGLSFLLNLLLIVRFRWIGVGFVLLYEPTKFYLLGDRFLSEAIIPYLLVFLFGIAWEKLNGKLVTKWDMLFASIATWFIIFSREPYVPVAITLLAAIVIHRKNHKIVIHRSEVIPFLILTGITLLGVPFYDYIYSVGYVSAVTVFKTEASGLLGPNLIQIALYPFFILVTGPLTLLRKILIAIDIVFLISFVLYIYKQRHFYNALFIWIALVIAGIRTVPPGTMFYEAFHLLPWYGLFIGSTLFLVSSLFRSWKLPAKIILIGAIVCISLFSIFSKESFITENIDPVDEFTIGYAGYQQYGEAIRILSNENDTLFLEPLDDVIYWVANRESAYQYALLTPINEKIPRYASARERMFRENPPDFYYCTEFLHVNLLPDWIQNQYVQLKKNGIPTCLFIYHKKISSIPDLAWKQAASIGITQ